MSQPNSSDPKKMSLLIEQLAGRANLRYTEVRNRMADYLRWSEYSEDRFNRLFRAHDTTRKIGYEMEDVLAIIHAFIVDLPEEKRCKAPDAFEIFNFAHFPPEQFRQLKMFFSDSEYRAAWEPYLHIYPADNTQPENDPNFLKPLYPPIFIGREQDIQTLTGWLIRKNSAQEAITVVRGWPGVGKTTLINRLVHDANTQLRQHFPDGVLWTSLGPTGNVLFALKNWARQLGAVHIQSIQRIETVIEELRRMLQNKKVLLIIDDIWDKAQSNLFKGLRSETTTFLFATRFTWLAYETVEVPERVYLLDVLPDDKALELMKLLAPKASAAYPEEVKDLIGTLEGLPLVIRIAGNLVEHEYRIGFDPKPLIHGLKENFGGFQHLAPSERFDEETGQTPTIEMLFQSSLRTLRRIEQEAFACMGGFAPKPATFDIFDMVGVCGLEDAAAIARSLVGQGLLEPLGHGYFQMHSTLCMYARRLLDKGLDTLQ